MKYLGQIKVTYDRKREATLRLFLREWLCCTQEKNIVCRNAKGEVVILDSLLGILVLVLPGMVAFYFLRNVGPVENRLISDYEKTVIGLLLNIPGLAFSWFALFVYKRRVVPFSEFQSILMKMPYFLLYIIFAFTIGILVALVWEKYGRHFFGRLINKTRADQGRPLSSDKSPWEEFFGSEESRFFRVYPIGEREKFVLGEVNNAFVPGERDQGIFLTVTGELAQWEKFFPFPERTYVDAITKMVYEMYPASAWEEAKRRASKESPNLSFETVEEGSS